MYPLATQFQLQGNANRSSLFIYCQGAVYIWIEGVFFQLQDLTKNYNVPLVIGDIYTTGDFIKKQLTLQLDLTGFIYETYYGDDITS